MKCVKNKSKLIFKREDGEIAVYDFKDGNLYRKRKNSDEYYSVKNAYVFFSGVHYSDIDFQDEKYKKFIKIISNKLYKCRSISTFLERLKKYSHLENYILLNMNFSNSIQHPTTIYNKRTLKLLIKYNVRIDNYLEQNYLLNKNTYDKMFVILDEYYYEYYNFINNFLSNTINSYHYHDDNFLYLIKTNNYNLKELINHVFYYNTREAISISNCLTLLKDYSNMQKNITKKFKKYPRYLRSIHDIVVSNYNTYKKEYSEELYQKTINLELEMHDKEHSIIYPKTTDDIKQEGIDLNHCVASYIESCVEGKTKILFLRKTKELDRSLITVEIKNNELIQASGEYNRTLTDSEKSFLVKYCKNKNIKNRMC